MASTLAHTLPRPVAFATRQEVASWAAGLAVTFALFFGMARLEKTGGAASSGPEIQDLPMVSMPLDAPPPEQRTAEPTQAVELLPTLAGLDLEETGSSVKIAALPPDLEAFVPDQHVPPPALVSVGRFSTTAKPQVGVEKIDVHRVYQVNEVDQRPMVLTRVPPKLWPAVYNWGPSISVSLMMRIDAEGRAEDVSVIRSCGHPEFDAAVVETVQNEWQFSPAVKRGRKVRCLVQQKFTLVIENHSAFGVH
jgi:TonB family protein